MNVINNIINSEFNEIIGNDDDIPIYVSKKFTRIKILVLGGGGIKGIAHIGAIKALEKLNITKQIKTIVSTSIGSLVGVMYTIGYTTDEMYSLSKKFNYENLKQPNILNILSNYGFDKGDGITRFIKNMLKNKDFSEETTMNELFDIKHVYLNLISACVNTKKIHIISHITEPNMPVYLAIRMSTSIPGYFAPVIYKYLF